MDKNEHAVDSQPTKMKQNGSTGKAPAMGNGNGAKVNNFKKAIGQLTAYSKAYVPMIILAMVLALVGSAFNVIGPDKLSDVTNLIQEGIATRVDIDAVQQIMLVLVMLYGLALIFNYVQGFITATIAQRISKKMRAELSQKINRIPLKYFDGTSHGNVLSRVTNDVDTIGQTLNNSLGTLVSALATFVGALVMMLYTNWIMTVTGILATLLGFALMSLIMKHSQKYFVAQQAELGQINGHIEETYTGHNVVKVYNGEPAAKEAFHDINSRLYTNAWKSQFMSGLMMPVMMFIGNFGYVAVCVVGAVLVNQQVITLGTIVAFMVYIRLFTQPLSQLAQAATNLQSAAAASERVFEFLGEEELADERDKTLRLDTVKGDVEFEHVRFGYNADRMIIKDFSMKAEAGQKIAIVGPIGAGKTTLVNLLMRFYELNGGEIYIDGAPISQLTRDNIHQLFCMVLQDTWLFEGTIRDNIIFSKVNVTDEQVEDASRAVGLHSFIKTLPQGYDTVLDDKATLSAGQKQLITIARAMIEDAPMLILDEATSSVDTRTELLIQQAMDQLTIGKTSFVIAHRLSTIKNADVILVMKDGDIIEMGNHVELLEKGGFYADLYNSQFEQAS